jgi:hypothetical protein
MTPEVLPMRARWFSLDLRTLVLSLAIIVLALALAARIAYPRYEWRTMDGLRPGAMLRIDRWTGETVYGRVVPQWGRWVSTDEYERTNGHLPSWW